MLIMHFRDDGCRLPRRRLAASQDKVARLRKTVTQSLTCFVQDLVTHAICMSVEAATAMLSLCGTQQMNNTLLCTDIAVVTTGADLSHNCLSLYIMPVTVRGTNNCMIVLHLWQLQQGLCKAGSAKHTWNTSQEHSRDGEACSGQHQ